MLNELLCAPMQQANVGVGALDHLSIQLKNQPQNAVLHSYTATKHEGSSRNFKRIRERRSVVLPGSTSAKPVGSSALTHQKKHKEQACNRNALRGPMQ